LSPKKGISQSADAVVEAAKIVAAIIVFNVFILKPSQSLNM
jgi:hypothetical protein